MGIRLSEIRDKKLRARIAAFDIQIRRRGCAESKSAKQNPLGGEIEAAPGMVHIDCPLLVRIVRKYDARLAKRYDDDNFIAGCKPLRDAIAAALSRDGDSEENGLWWEYRQEIGEPEIRIEVFEKL